MHVQNLVPTYLGNASCDLQQLIHSTFIDNWHASKDTWFLPSRESSSSGGDKHQKQITMTSHDNSVRCVLFTNYLIYLPNNATR